MGHPSHSNHSTSNKKRDHDESSGETGIHRRSQKKQRVNSDREPEPSNRQQNHVSSDSAQQYNDNPNLSRALSFTPFTTPSSRPSPKGSNKPVRYTKPTRPYTGHPSTLPPLPPILSPSLVSLPFIHQGIYSGSSGSKVHGSYERLEFLGDAYIEIIATRFVYTFFPNLPAGKLSQRRELCVKNHTLAEYATAYGFPERAQLPPEINKEGKQLWRKTMGDIFEAYVAAIILSDPEFGFQTAEAWLTTLWEYEVTKHQRTTAVEAQNPPLDAKNELSRKIGGRNTVLEYRDERPPEKIRDQGKIIFHVALYLNGWNWENQYLGRGSGLNKQDAGAMAAAEALRNPLVQEVHLVKKGYEAKVAETRKKGQEIPPFRRSNGKMN